MNMCLNPKWIYKKGTYKENNYRGLAGEPYEIGLWSKCGSCQVCMNEKCNNWIVRNYYEEKIHQDKCFITLTYQDSPLILVRKDLTNFIKRLRQYLDYHEENKKIRLYTCGEYGVLNNRPHFHAIIYGWRDKNAKYLGINKKKNIIYQSKIIQDIWGLGRTSYQEFNEHEIPYIALYDTPKETFKRAYKLTREKIKKIESICKQNIKNPNQYKNLSEELNIAKKALENEKEKFYMVKEFNGWSLALGWEEFEKEYINSNEYVFKHYIEDKEFVTPTPWLKKLANKYGDVKAAEEIFRREKEVIKTFDEDEERYKSTKKINMKKNEEIMEWNMTKNEVEF